MARPFRHESPSLRDDLVPRLQVQQALAGRFDRRVTLIVAGAGFGKTTALVRAFEENRLRPLGRDVWLGCEPADADPDHFAVGLAAALGLDETPETDELVRTVGEWVGGQSPTQICLVLDDVHLVEGRATPRLLADMVEALPSNGHLVVCGRRRPDVPLTRLELTGQCHAIGEADLQLDDEQVRALLGDDAADVSHLAGWPALIQLARQGRSERFVIEEVVDLLSDDQSKVLHALVAIGEADVDLLEQVTGVDAATALDEIPLVHRSGPRWGAHDLWTDLAAVDDPVGLRLAAARALLDRGEPAVAVDVLIADAANGESRVDEMIDAALRDVLIDVDLIPAARVRRWDATLPASTSPVRQLLRGAAIRLDNPGSDACHHVLQSAADGFLAADDPAAAVAALSALTFAYHVRRDVAGLLATFEQLNRLADAGVVDARPFPLLGAGLVATAQGDLPTVFAHTEQLLQLELTTEVRAVALWLHANALCNAGLDAVEPARECYEMGLPLPGIAMVHCNARLRAGLIRELLDEPTEPTDGERDRFLLATWGTIIAAIVDDVDEARRQLAIVESSSATEAQWQTTGSVLIPRAVVAMAEGRDDDAVSDLREFVASTPRDGPGSFYYTGAISAVYRMLPELRPWYDELAADGRLGPQQLRDLHLTSMLTRIIEAKDPSAASGLELPATPGEFLAVLGPAGGATVLAACTGVGRDDLDDVVAEYVDLLGERARVQLRSVAESQTDWVASGAKQLLESIPVAPREPLSIALLGGTELSAGGRRIDGPDWRRERVRALLTYLVLHPDTTREAAIAALWPDADPTGGRRSLRSTLNVLHSVLEPDRRGGDAPYFIRSIGQRIRLVTGEHLTVDVERFERLLDEAAALDRGGSPSQSIAPFLEAVELYRGDLLPDSYDDWVVFARDRLRGRYVAAGVRAAELLLMTGRSDEAVDVAVRMLESEPWSEPAHRALISAHLDRGDVATARRCLDTCDRALADVGGPADPETDHLRHRLAAR